MFKYNSLTQNTCIHNIMYMKFGTALESQKPHNNEESITHCITGTLNTCMHTNLQHRIHSTIVTSTKREGTSDTNPILLHHTTTLRLYSDTQFIIHTSSPGFESGRLCITLKPLCDNIGLVSLIYLRWELLTRYYVYKLSRCCLLPYVPLNSNTHYIW